MLKHTTFKFKIMTLTLFFIVMTIALATAISEYYGETAGQETVTERLNNALSIQNEFLNQQAEKMELISLLVASEPAFASYVAEAINFYQDEGANAYLTSIYDLLLERKQQYGFDFAVITTPEGLQLAHSDQPISVIRDLSQMELLTQSMQQLIPLSGYWLDNDSLYQTAIVPIARGQSLVGFLITGNSIDDAYLSRLSRLTDTNIMAFLQHKQHNSTVASSAEVVMTRAFEKQMKNMHLQELLEQTQNTVKVNRELYAYTLQELPGLPQQKKVFLLASVSRSQILSNFLHSRMALISVAIVMALLAASSLYFANTLFFKELRSLVNRVKSINKHDVTQTNNISTPELRHLDASIVTIKNEVTGRQALAKHVVEVSKKVPESHDYFWHESEDTIIKPNQVIGSRFKILNKIGAGGMGMVFQAIDTELNEVVALKVLIKDSSKSLELKRFKDEISLARRIHDPNVVRIHDFGKIGGHAFISMEYIRGYTIADILEFSKKLRPSAALYTSTQICKGLIAAHSAGIVHRDLKPQNLIVELDNTIKLMDFGIATVQSHVSKNQQQETIEGTIAYASPEQIQGKGADERSDIYALGTLIMELFTGFRPYHENDEEQLMIKKVTESPTLISDYWASAPVKLESIILKCLKIDPLYRYQQVSELLHDLECLQI